MKILNSVLKIGAIVLFAVLAISSCKKTEDPYAAYTPEREAGLIKDWLAQMVSTGQNIDTTSTGIYYIVEKAGIGVTVQAGDTVTVTYTGMFMDGTVFDASEYHDGAMTYVHKGDDSRMISGWEEGIEVTNKGSKTVFCIPSAKAYGPNGYSSIPPNTPLIFVIEVIDIK